MLGSGEAKELKLYYDIIEGYGGRFLGRCLFYIILTIEQS